ncbi:MAG: DinB family protein, partial [Candidatus Latescibacterota bacterium]
MVYRAESEIGRLADQLERSFHGGAWHGPATREVIAEIDADTAGRRPVGSLHSVVEIVRHITYWIKAAYIRISEGRDAPDEVDWAEHGALSEEGWSQAIENLDRAYSKLHSTLLGLDDSRLNDAVAGSDPTVRGLVLGTLQHNAYHTGQIVLIAKEMAT